MLYGPSGVGKSSVLQAGVVRQIRDENSAARSSGSAPSRPSSPTSRSGATTRTRRWRAAVSTRRSRRVPTTPSGRRPGRDDIAGEDLRPCPQTARVDLLLILDQFEEFFLYHQPDSRSSPSCSLELTERGTRVNVLISIREDALARLGRVRGRIARRSSTTRLRLDHLDEDRPEAAIRKPLRTLQREPARGPAVRDRGRAGRGAVAAGPDRPGPGRLHPGGGDRALPWRPRAEPRTGADRGAVPPARADAAVGRGGRSQGPRMLRLSTLRELGRRPGDRPAAPRPGDARLLAAGDGRAGRCVRAPRHAVRLQDRAPAQRPGRVQRAGPGRR